MTFRRFARALAAAAVIIGVGALVLMMKTLRPLASTLCWVIGVLAAFEVIERLTSPALALLMAIFTFGFLIGRLWQMGQTSTTHHA